MIKQLKVSGLNQKLTFDLMFHEDFNILTGRNGSGKTTVLKLIWYIISGNCEHVFEEMSLEHAELSTDRFSITIRSLPRPHSSRPPTIEWTIKSTDGTMLVEAKTRPGMGDGP